MPALFNFISPWLTLKYLSLCFFSVLGVLQIVAGRRDIEGLSLLPASLRRWQIPLGVILAIAAFAVFFAVTPEVFTPGLAGAELITLFGVGAVLALLFALAIAQLRWKPPAACIQAPESVELPGCEGVFWGSKPGGGAGQARALCLVPDPAEPCLLDELGRRLAQAGFSALILRWREAPDFEGALGTLALAMRALSRERGFRWVGLVGHRLGGDIALRFAGEDEEVKAVVAVAPFLDSKNLEPGLAWMKEAPILSAHRRLRGKARLLRELAPVEHLSELEGRLCLVVSEPHVPLKEREWLRIVKIKGESPWRFPLSKRVAEAVVEWLRKL